MSTLLFTIITLTVIGLCAAVILHFTARKFYVYEDERIDEVQEKLPGANCGGCGTAGCRAFAEKLVNAEDLTGLFCPVGGNDVMAPIAAYLGKSVQSKESLVAVVRCSGSFEHRERTNRYDGVLRCSVQNALYTGDTGCPYGCLGCGDCVSACEFGALRMDPNTGLPVVDDDKCTACGACVKACPRHIIELRKKGVKNRKIYVSCVNKDKGGIARKYCTAACIGCSKCVKVCTFEAITLVDNLAYIDSNKCRMCRKCVEQCPTQAILEFNFPARKPAVSTEVPVSTEIGETAKQTV